MHVLILSGTVGDVRMDLVPAAHRPAVTTWLRDGRGAPKVLASSPTPDGLEALRDALTDAGLACRIQGPASAAASQVPTAAPRDSTSAAQVLAELRDERLREAGDGAPPWRRLGLTVIGVLVFMFVGARMQCECRGEPIEFELTETERDGGPVDRLDDEERQDGRPDEAAATQRISASERGDGTTDDRDDRNGDNALGEPPGGAAPPPEVDPALADTRVDATDRDDGAKPHLFFTAIPIALLVLLLLEAVRAFLGRRYPRLALLFDRTAVVMAVLLVPVATWATLAGATDERDIPSETPPPAPTAAGAAAPRSAGEPQPGGDDAETERDPVATEDDPAAADAPGVAEFVHRLEAPAPPTTFASIADHAHAAQPPSVAAFVGGLSRPQARPSFGALAAAATSPPAPDDPAGADEAVHEAADGTPTGGTATDDTPNGDTRTDDTPNGATPTDDTPTDDTPTNDTLNGDTPNGNTPNGNTPNGRAPDDGAPTDDPRAGDPTADDTPTAQAPTDSPHDAPTGPPSSSAAGTENDAGPAPAPSEPPPTGGTPILIAGAQGLGLAALLECLLAIFRLVRRRRS